MNVHGRPGKNIPVDLHMEHLNKIAKGAISFLGSNKSKMAIKRIGHAIGTLSPVLDNFDEENHVATLSTRQRKPRALNDIEVVVNELIKAESFVVKEKQKNYTAFPHPKDVLHAKDKNELLEWLVSKLPRSF